MALLRHEIISETIVALTFGAPGEPTRTVIASPNEAKRFAWGLLADLDPDEASEPAPPKPRRYRQGSGRLHTAAVLDAIRRDDLNVVALAAACETSRGTIYREIRRLEQAGRIRRTQGGSRYAEAFL